MAIDDAALLHLLKATPDLLCIGDGRGYLRWVNPRWEDLLGWTPEELTSSPSTDFVHPADVDATKAEIRCVVEGRSTREFENRYRTRDGNWIWLQWSATADPDTGLIYCAVRDVTEARRSRLQLEERSRIFEMTEEIVGVGYWRIELATGSLLWTPKVYEIYGLDPDLTSPDVEQAIEGYHPDDREMVAAGVQRAIDEGERFDFSARIIRPSGEIRHVESSGVAEVDNDGETTAIFGIFRDVTRSRELEELMRHSERMASLGTLAAGVAHEINNPLTWLSGNLDLILEGLAGLDVSTPDAAPSDPSELISAAHAARDAGNRIRRIVHGLRDFSQESPGQAATSVEGIVRVATAMARNQIRHRARLITSVDPAATILCDDTQITQVMVNLLVNAAQAIPEGHASEHQISVDVWPSQDRVVIEVRDTGRGIPEIIRNRVFEPFFTTKPVGMGTGLGLSIVHGIVEAHDGTIEVTSEPGLGTTFRLSFPAVDAVPPDSSSPAPLKRAPTRREGEELPLLLVADDEPALLRLVVRASASFATTLTAASGQEAIDLLKEHPEIQGVCCDLMMPDIGGIGVWEWIEAHRPELLPRVMLMTGGIFTAEAREFARDRKAAMLQKPFGLDTLRTRLNSLLNDSGAAARSGP